jgi:hypothetical protein
MIRCHWAGAHAPFRERLLHGPGTCPLRSGLHRQACDRVSRLRKIKARTWPISFTFNADAS